LERRWRPGGACYKFFCFLRSVYQTPESVSQNSFLIPTSQKVAGTASFERCGNQEFCTRISALKINGLVGAKFSCKNGRRIRRRGEDRAAFPLVAASREKARFPATRAASSCTLSRRKVVYLASPQDIRANVFAPCIARPQPAETMRGAAWRSGATSIEGDDGEKRQFKLIHPQVSDWPEAGAAWMAGHRAGRTPVFRRGMNGANGWA
jgi:hypothetical protein